MSYLVVVCDSYSVLWLHDIVYINRHLLIELHHGSWRFVQFLFLIFVTKFWIFELRKIRSVQCFWCIKLRIMLTNKESWNWYSQNDPSFYYINKEQRIKMELWRLLLYSHINKLVKCFIILAIHYSEEEILNELEF